MCRVWRSNFGHRGVSQPGASVLAPGLRPPRAGGREPARVETRAAGVSPTVCVANAPGIDTPHSAAVLARPRVPARGGRKAGRRFDPPLQPPSVTERSETRYRGSPSPSDRPISSLQISFDPAQIFVTRASAHDREISYSSM